MNVQGFSGDGLTPFVSRWQAGGSFASGNSDSPRARLAQASQQNTSSVSDNAVDAFASTVVDNTTPVLNPETTQDETTSSQDGTSSLGTAEELKSALADAIRYIRDTHGDEAATQAMNTVGRRVDGDGMSETELGDALLGVIKYTDQQFGIQAGNALINQFNGALNDALNAHFQNGSHEAFHATTTYADGTTTTTGPTAGMAVDAATLAERFGSDAEDAGVSAESVLETILEDAREGTSSLDPEFAPETFDQAMAPLIPGGEGPASQLQGQARYAQAAGAANTAAPPSPAPQTVDLVV